MKPIKRISDDFARQAVQIMSNYCEQTFNEVGCLHCQFWDTEIEGCLFYGDLPERFINWKTKNKVKIVNG